MLEVEDLTAAHDGQTLTVRTKLEPAMVACTKSVPPNCWGNIAARSASGGKAPSTTLAGSFQGHPIRCAFPPSGPTACTPAIDFAKTFHVTGKVTKLGNGVFEIEPTAIDPI